jgi:hypothetical protein
VRRGCVDGFTGEAPDACGYCPADAVGVCAGCDRPVCRRHVQYYDDEPGAGGEGDPVCVECNQRAGERRDQHRFEDANRG